VISLVCSLFLHTAYPNCRFIFNKYENLAKAVACVSLTVPAEAANENQIV